MNAPTKSKVIKNRLIWPSILRISATSGIFMFHFFRLLDVENYNLDLISILIFCFLSGFLSGIIEEEPERWFLRKFSAILIPYWVTIIPVVILNRVIQYKETSLLSDIITILGGNLFLKDPIYVIAWYITFVMLLYSYLYGEFKIRNKTNKIVHWLVWTIFAFYLNTLVYFLAFSSGIVVSGLSTKSKLGSSTLNLNESTSTLLFRVQGYCYAFFLVHGGVMLAVFKYIKPAGKLNFLTLSLLGSILSCIVLRKLTDPFIQLIANKKLLNPTR